MADFKLEPPSLLGTAGTRMEGLSVSTRKAESYVEDGPGKLEQVDARIFFIALRDHKAVVQKIEDNIKRGGQLLHAVGNNLDTAQTRYDGTEDDNTVRVNDIFAKLESSTSGAPSLGSHGSATTFGSDLPGDGIPPGQPFAGIPDWAELIVELGGSLVSPTFWAMKVLEWTIGVNPIDWFTAELTGDWKGVTAAGDSFQNVGKYWTAMGNDLADDCGVIFRGWEGDASDSAQSYFRRLIEAHHEQEPALSTLGHNYISCGTGIYFAAKGIGALISLISDLTIGAALLAAAIAVAAGSVVGAPEAAAMAVALDAMLDAILGIWNTVLAVQAGVVGGAYTFGGLLAGYLSTLHSVEQLEMPNEG